MKRDRGTLQDWYRQAMVRRIEELEELRPAVRNGQLKALDAVRGIGEALRGSGATFGFPRLSDAARIVEECGDTEVLLRLEGLRAVLGSLTLGERGGRPLPADWVAHAVDLPAEALEETTSVSEAWVRAGEQAGLDGAAVAGAVARYFGLERADPSTRGRAAVRLVPEALVTGRRVVPFSEDARTITVATSDPADLAAELELQSLTGRTPVFCIAPPEEIDLWVDELFGGVDAGSDVPEPEPITIAGPHTPRVPLPAADAWPEMEEDDEADDPSLFFAVPEPIGPIGTAAASEASRLAGGDDPEEADGNGPGPVREALVVDDEPSARLLVRSMLERGGWSVVEASDGLEALDIMRDRSRPSAVVADLKMPRMDGLEFLWTIRDEPRWAGLPVVVVTGERDAMLETQLLEEGADDYVRKPLEPRLFLARLESAVRRRAG